MLLEKLLEAPGGADWRPLGTPGGSWGAAGDSWRLPEAPVQQRQSLHALGAPEVLGEHDQCSWLRPQGKKSPKIHQTPLER